MLIVTGAIKTLFSKWENKTPLSGDDICPENVETCKFSHPFIQVTLMFTSEALCYLGFFY